MALGEEAQDRPGPAVDHGGRRVLPGPVIDRPKSSQVVDQPVDDVAAGRRAGDDGLARERRKQGGAGRFGAVHGPDSDDRGGVSARSDKAGVGAPACGDNLPHGVLEGRLGTLDHHERDHRVIVPCRASERNENSRRWMAQLDDDGGFARLETPSTVYQGPAVYGPSAQIDEVVMRRLGIIAVVISLAVLTTGCSSSSTGNATDPTVVASDDGATIDPNEPPAGGGGGGDVPVIEDATYTGGTAHVVVSGQKSVTVDAPLVVGASVTVEGTTLLSYHGGDGQDAVTFSVTNSPDTGPAIIVTTAFLITGGDRSTGCTIELTRNDGSGVSGTFACSGLRSVVDQATVDVNGTFSANR